MENLNEKHCEACHPDAPKLSKDDIDAVLAQLPNWSVIDIDIDDVPKFCRVFKFGQFLDAMAFLNKVGRLAESEDHHPAMLLEWGKVTVTWWTHKIHGLHRNDAIMAAKTDAMYADG